MANVTAFRLFFTSWTTNAYKIGHATRIKFHLKDNAIQRTQLWQRERQKAIVLRRYSHDTGIIFILEGVHSIGIHLFLFAYMIPKRNFFPVQVIIPVFNPNKIRVLVRNFILVSFKLKTNFDPDWKSRVAHAYLIWRENHASESALGWAVTNVTLERNSFIPVS